MSADTVSNARSAPLRICKRYFANTVPDARSVPLRTSKDTLRTQCPTRAARPCAPTKILCEHSVPRAARPCAPAKILCEHSARRPQRAPAHQQRYFANTVSHARSVPLRTSKDSLRTRAPRAQRAPAHQQEDTLRTQDPTRADEALRPQRCFANTVRFELVSECGLRSQRKFATRAGFGFG